MHKLRGVTNTQDGTGQRWDVPSHPITKIWDETANAYTDIGR